MEYYGSWNRDQLMIINGWQRGELDLDELLIHLYDDERWLRRLLEQFPQADADGYEAMIARGILMARYRDGYASPKPLEEGTVYHLTLDLWSTASVFDAGHRIGFLLTSSEFGRYEVHPNSWDPVESYRDAAVAHNTIHLSAEHPSRVIIPVVEPGTTEDYDPSKHALCRKSRTREV